jgi:hypothetical protein
MIAISRTWFACLFDIIEEISMRIADSFTHHPQLFPLNPNPDWNIVRLLFALSFYLIENDRKLSFFLHHKIMQTNIFFSEKETNQSHLEFERFRKSFVSKQRFYLKIFSQLSTFFQNRNLHHWKSLKLWWFSSLFKTLLMKC